MDDDFDKSQELNQQGSSRDHCFDSAPEYKQQGSNRDPDYDSAPGSKQQGFSKDNHKFYTGKKWIHLRDVILRRDGYCDQVLKRYGKMRQAENVHHIFPLEEFPEYRYEAWNLISLSHNTHMRMHKATSGELSPEGVELLRRTCRKLGREIPLRYQSPPV